MSLVARRLENETWRDCVSRVAGKHNLETECLAAYDEGVKTITEEEAAWEALYEWDCLDFEP